MRHTSLALGEGDVPSRLVLDEFNFDFSAAGLLVRLWLVVVVVVIAGRVDCVVVVDERVICHGWLARNHLAVGVSVCRAWLVHVESALPLSHGGGDWILGVHAEHDDDERGNRRRRGVYAR